MASPEHVGQQFNTKALAWGGREQWKPGTRAHFEYHCNESHNSPDAPIWYHSHQRVTVLSEHEEEGTRREFPTQAERAEAGQPVTYEVRHPNGFQHTAFEDELMRAPRFFQRPNPPRRKLDKYSNTRHV